MLNILNHTEERDRLLIDLFMMFLVKIAATVFLLKVVDASKIALAFT